MQNETGAAVEKPAKTAAPANKTYFGVQALRAVAALMVVVDHAENSWAERIMVNQKVRLPWPNGMAGVDIFFVISGFVMMVSSQSLIGRANNGWIFLRRRFIRIVPLYWIFTTLKIVRLKLGPAVGEQTVGNPWHVIASYLFIPSLNNGKPSFPVLATGWTLNFEMMFYCLFALALALDVASLEFLLLVLGGVAAVGWFPHPSWPTFTELISPIVLEFLFGVALAHFALRGRLPGRRLGAALLVAGAAAIALVPVYAPAEAWVGEYFAARALCWGMPAAVLVAGAVALEEPFGRKLPRWLLEAGNASYSIYLVHLFVVSVVWVALLKLGLTGAPALAAMIVLSPVLSLAAGEVVHRWIELPLMKLFRGKRVRGVSVLPA